MGLKFRRGTNAQKSGSLAFGEPYVNTDLGTLQIGGATGDITLGASGTGSQGSFAGISGSSLDITGNAKIDGNLTLGGAITIGDATADTVNVVASLSSSLIPQTTNAFDLGSASKIWRDLYISTGSIKFVDNAGTIVAGLTAQGLQNISSSAITFSQMASNGQFALRQESNNFTGSQSISGNILITGSIIPGVTNTYDLGSETKFWRDLYISTGSIKFVGAAGTIVGTLSNSGNGMALDGGVIARGDSTFGTSSAAITNVTGSLNVSGAINLVGNQNITGSIIPGVTNTYDLGSPTKQFRHLYISTGSLYMNGTAILSSNATDLTLTTDNGQSLKLLETAADTITLQTAEGNLTLTSTGAGDVILDPTTGIIALKGTTTLYAGNKIVSSDGNAIQIGNNVAITGSLTTTTGLTVGGDFVVNGTTTTIDSTNINIGDNIIVLNGTVTTNGGIYVKDGAGASTLTGSLLWDTTNDKWIAGTLGSELAILRAGGDSVVSSSTQIPALLPTGVVSGSAQTIANLPTGTVSGSSQVTGIGNAQLTNSSTTIGTTAIALGASATTIAGLTSVTSTTFVGALTGNASTVTTNANLTGNVTSVGNATTIASGVVTSDMIVDGTIVNGDINASAAIVDTKLATIATAGKVSNSATTATSANTANAIVARDGSGNFSAGTITAALTGNASTATTAGTVTTAAQSAITSVGTLTSLTVSGATATGALTVTGAVTATGDITAFFTSDKRHKNNIQTIPNALEKVTKLNGVTWEWNDDVNEVTKSTPKTGLIAQEVQEVLPEVVKTRDDGFLALDYSKMMGLLVEAIKEQQIQIEELKAQIGSK